MAEWIWVKGFSCIRVFLSLRKWTQPKYLFAYTFSQKLLSWFCHDCVLFLSFWHFTLVSVILHFPQWLSTELTCFFCCIQKLTLCLRARWKKTSKKWMSHLKWNPLYSCIEFCSKELTHRVCFSVSETLHQNRPIFQPNPSAASLDAQNKVTS